ncbi:non-hydrolyzing UDP-N-acetylglucosamine 2-epimerase [Heliophilum fasciatum]|uniref:UDP-N-acetylglucosamine 2-epimerase (non-hydrolyzing) n=1 Tax=Heliophilum fasciatum TaxID=35700 RepID=A0A4V2SXB1_9FIRM|nr:UDP-N-acetylglucosamine 2-epimerase (non-hydrolyzing) [Heliophilum fasciatum]MCW2277483.1 UDP-N-acetylglucosamine 2-epimerase (non-hydrolyzing) [Heliophilum fasciatum]TCP65226.1 UDP-N-acetylglucosamine 2-epimerase (non-hydrolysing) [Heliophilum fasciatum]
MRSPITVLSVFGTRPEAIKMAPVVKALEAYGEPIRSRVAVTAQHREMLDQVLRLFSIVPDEDLNIMAPEQTLYDVTSRALLGLRDVFTREKPDLVLVHGDTTTTFIASLAAYYQQIPVGHVEAGLRTGNKYSPFPEEMNRRLTGAIAELHFAPTATSEQNLLQEAVAPSGIYITGNTVIDALLATVRPDYTFADPALNAIDFAKQEVLLVTTHRRENLGEPMRQVYTALKTIIETRPKAVVIFPVHKNPAVRRVVAEVLGDLDRVHLIEPMDYEPFVNLMARSTLILTDSGGMQEEAPSLGKPVLVLRDTTERPEAVEAGTVKLVGTDGALIVREALTLLSDPLAYGAMANAVNPYGDGQASQRIAQAIAYHFGLTGERPDAFIPRA